MPTTAPTEKQKPVLSIITVFWNPGDEVDHYFHALESCRNNARFTLEVIAVDNASADGTAGRIRKQYPWAQCIENAQNLGFAEGCNVGLRKANGDYLLLLNPDCEAREEALEHMISLLARNAKIGVVGCTLLHGDGLPQHSHHHEPSWWSYWSTHSLLSPLVLRVRKILLGTRELKKPRQVAWLMGACMMLRRSTLQQVGLLDPEYFMYSEDSDYCRRIRNKGMQVIYDPRVHMVHHHGTTARRRAEFTFRRLYKSLLRYSSKHHSKWECLALRTAVMVDFLLRLPVYALGSDKERFRSAVMILKAYSMNSTALIRT